MHIHLKRYHKLDKKKIERIKIELKKINKTYTIEEIKLEKNIEKMKQKEKIKDIKEKKIEEGRLKKLICLICNNEYATKDSLILHTKSFHPKENLEAVKKRIKTYRKTAKEKPRKCPLCDSLFTYRKSLNSHFHKKHSDVEYNKKIELLDNINV